MSRTDLRTVRLIGVPLELFHRAQSHHDDLFREFALIASSSPQDRESVPTRLLALIEDIRARFSGFTAATQAQIESAIERGDAAIDVEFLVPVELREAAIAFAELLEEADRFCLSGNLLTLAAPPAVLAFRRWYLSEFAAQLDGVPPRPWSDLALEGIDEPA